MNRRHSMPFGAELQDDGRVRFRLWAPGAQQVELALEEGATLLPMTRTADGWYELVTERAGSGSGYRYRINGELLVPDPASRFQPEDVQGPSQVVDAAAFHWQDQDWRGRPWEEAVIYELHTGTFTPAGTFAAIEDKLDDLLALGVTAIELLPVADFPGRWNWGYDGVLLFAPDSSYGTPDDLKHLIQTAHQKGLMVFLDVVYNHFGPDGNYLHSYAPQFFTERHPTPWGAGINYDGSDSRPVRDFFIHNALYWIEEYHLDGLRLDAVHAIEDDSDTHILHELAQAVRSGPGKDRLVHLILENDRNAARHLVRDDNGGIPLYNGQWNDDIHHALHTLLTGERDGYYAPYAEKPAWYLGRCLTEGFGFQGETSPYHEGERRGEDSRHLPAGAFINFLQNHDQVGNRAFGDRIHELTSAEALRAGVAVLLLAPSPVMLYMGEEFAAASPFQYFCDFANEELAKAVREGRRGEFSKFERFSDPKVRETIPDPNSPDTRWRSVLDWDSRSQPPHAATLKLYRELLDIRHRCIVPRLKAAAQGQVQTQPGMNARFELLSERALEAQWTLPDGSRLSLWANLSAEPVAPKTRPDGKLLYATGAEDEADLKEGRPMQPWLVAWFVSDSSNGN